MTKYVKDMLSNDSNKSSARVINFVGALLGSCLLAYDTAIHGRLDNDNFLAFLAYCGGVYGISKGLDKVGNNAHSN